MRKKMNKFRKLLKIFNINIHIEGCKPHLLVNNVEGTSVNNNSDSVPDEDSDDSGDFTGFRTPEEVEVGNSKKNKTKVVKVAKRGRPPKRNTLNSMVEVY